MFYETANQSRELFDTLGLRHNPFTTLVVPRPIGWISTINAEGRANLAPFSFFNAVSSAPPMVMYCANASHSEEGDKDSLANARATGEFVANLATFDLQRQMNDSSSPAPRAIDEFDLVGLTKAPSRLVKPPRVAESPVHLECAVVRIVELPTDEKTGERNTLTVGRVLAVHIDDSLINEGRVDISRARPLARMGYLDYAVIDSVFPIKRPSWPLAPK